MGAPGNYILCPEGHVIGMIKDDLYWGEPEDESSVWKELEKLENSKCHICGKLAKYSFYYYGYEQVNDCLHTLKLRFDNENRKWIMPKDSKFGFRYMSKEQIKELNSCVIIRSSDNILKGEE